MKYFDVPVIGGSVEEQIEQIRDYLLAQHDVLNYNLGQQTPEKVFLQAQTALTQSASPIESEETKSRYKALRDLIIGTANEAFKAGDGYSEVLRQIEGYRSDYGTFVEEITRQIGTAPSGTTDLYSYIGSVQTIASGAATAAGSAASAAAAAQGTADGAAAAIQSYQLRMQNFIKTGFLDTTTNPPTFGVEIGTLLTEYTEDGQTVQVTPGKIRITSDRIGFWTGSGQSETEAAYISSGAVYFPNAQITGGAISGTTISAGAAAGGVYPFSVDANGKLTATGADISGKITATSGTFSGTVTAASGSTFGGWTIGENAIYRGVETFGNANTLYFGVNGLSIKDTFKVDSTGKLTCNKAEIGGWTVTSTGLERLMEGLGGVLASLDGSGLTFGSGAGGGSGSSTNYTGVDNVGILRARGAIISGTIYAGAGEIGGWTIASDRLKKVNSSGNGIELIPGSTPQIKIKTAVSTTLNDVNAVAAYISRPTLYATDGTNNAYYTPVGLYNQGGSDIAYFGRYGLFNARSNAFGYWKSSFIFEGEVAIHNISMLAATTFRTCGNNYIELGGYTVAWGKTDVRLSSGEATNETISYPVTFGETAFVVATLATTNPHMFHVGISDRGRSSFKVTIKPDGSTYSGDMGVLWLAICKN